MPAEKPQREGNGYKKQGPGLSKLESCSSVGKDTHQKRKYERALESKRVPHLALLLKAWEDGPDPSGMETLSIKT